MKNNHDQTGYIALTTLSILGAVLLLLVIGGFGVSISRSQVTGALRRSAEATYLVESCVEEVLLQLYETDAFSEPVILPEGQCSVTETGRAGSIVDIEVSGTLDSFTHTVEVSVDTTKPMKILSWNEPG